jgi:hypothetical protein
LPAFPRPSSQQAAAPGRVLCLQLQAQQIGIQQVRVKEGRAVDVPDAAILVDQEHAQDV